MAFGVLKLLKGVDLNIPNPKESFTGKAFEMSLSDMAH
jgi:hypothetical protein